MDNTLATHALEESTYYITVTCKNKNDVEQAPTVLKWTLTDMAGTVINNRDEVSVANPTASEEITLSGDDLAFSTDEIESEILRILTITSTLDGNPLTGRTYFWIDNLEAI
jgi:hypothetical protein